MTESSSWLPHYRTAREALGICFLTLFLNPWEAWEIRERVAHSAYFQKYSGEWRNVQEFLNKVDNSETLEDYVKEKLGFDDFFGNFLRECERLLKRNPDSFKPLVRDERKPKRLIRHRGYRDKGTLRPYDKRGRNLGETTPGEDERYKIITLYKSLRQKEENETTQEEI